jgi:hypothetical protein
MIHGHITATSVKIDTDEGRIVLLIESDEDDTITVDIHGCALEFYAQVQARLYPYVIEAEMARATMSTYDEADAYEIDDPKHPTYHERMAD